MLWIKNKIENFGCVSGIPLNKSARTGWAPGGLMHLGIDAENQLRPRAPWRHSTSIYTHISTFHSLDLCSKLFHADLEIGLLDGGSQDK